MSGNLQESHIQNIFLFYIVFVLVEAGCSDLLIVRTAAVGDVDSMKPWQQKRSFTQCLFA